MFDSEDVSSLVEPEMRGKRRTYDGPFKARVVREWINGKRSLNEQAKRYGIHPNQIKNWKSTLLKRAGQVLDDRRRTGPSRPSVLRDEAEVRR